MLIVVYYIHMAIFMLFTNKGCIGLFILECIPQFVYSIIETVTSVVSYIYNYIAALHAATNCLWNSYEITFISSQPHIHAWVYM